MQPSRVCATLRFDVPSTDGPGTLWAYFETTVDTSFSMIYLLDDQLRRTWNTNNY